jgi:hypothetical protein
LAFPIVPFSSAPARRRQLFLFPRGYVSRQISASKRQTLLGSTPKLDNFLRNGSLKTLINSDGAQPFLPSSTKPKAKWSVSYQPCLRFASTGQYLISPACDLLPPARRACGRRFYWGDRGWRALPTFCKCFELNILAISTTAPSHQTHTRAPAGVSITSPNL